MTISRFLASVSLVLIPAVSPAASQAEVPAVVADLPVAHSLVAQVMGTLGSPTLLLAQGGDPHHVQLRPSQARAVAAADLVVWTSGALSPWMADVVASLATGAALELAAVDGTLRQETGDTPRLAGDDHDDHDDHDHPYDPHLWLNTGNARLWLSAIADELARIDPENAPVYADNAAAAQVEIAFLAQEVTGILAPVGDAGLVMFHDAFGYFAAEFGLDILGTVAVSDAADPGGARIAALRAALQDAGAVCIFPEVNHNAGPVAVVAEGSALRIGAALDPAGVMLAPGADLYARTLTGLAHAVADCVGAARW